MSCTLRESYEAIQECQQNKSSKLTQMQEEAKRIHDDHAEELRDIKESREFRYKCLAEYKENVYADLLGSALKGIYITSLSECTFLEKNDYALANRLVDNYINENGAKAILNRMKGKTYLLDSIREDVEDAADETVEKSDDEDVETNTIPSDEPKEKMFDKMENNGDVDSAVEIISNRIADAEKEFVQKNIEDKQKIEDIVNSVNARITAVKGDTSMDDQTKEDIAQECYVDQKRHINDVYEKRTHSVFEEMAKQITESVVKNPELKASYTTEDGTLNMDKIIRSTKCMYGFLEFVNAIQLETVTPQYMNEMLEKI